MNFKEKIILHVDDDPDDRDLLREVMQKVAPNVKLTFAINGLQALETLNLAKETQSLPCLIVLDLNMPYLNGAQTFERIKADTSLSKIPIVVLSSGENPSDKSMFSQAGVDYFAKPIEFSALKAIGSHLANLCC
ncbi:response regulator receiver domain-containing protein [Algoriphagus ratkowskyi]|uniref:Response regulator receiver domain-containing protein n=1 Tax=Algoriphagus ratkowskyi TaxID=57028 RepID=A0A2W7SYN9_9BACT|nr:response regulator [Algoriphagus ratkowskyi]PZX55942.1 response regulator receiver domain-containing protein [Algoriphagus ratkowskyi]TXD77245.1 response regulator transcription factor [Algoriphagus ratkowskyi]